MSARKIKVRHREQAYAEKYRTDIWQEENNSDNPFVDTDARCRGYALGDLVQNVSYTEMVFLMLKGELPTPSQSKLLDRLFVAFSHPGLRNEATRAAILAGVGKTLPSHVLPIGMLVYGGDATGAGEVEKTMRFLRKHARRKPADVVVSQSNFPGFGDYYGSADKMAAKLSAWLQGDGVDTPHLAWGDGLAQELRAVDSNFSWTRPGVAAAAFCDLGILPRYGVGLLQMIAAPGLLAQGMEHANKPATVLPFISDEDYELTHE